MFDNSLPYLNQIVIRLMGLSLLIIGLFLLGKSRFRQGWKRRMLILLLLVGGLVFSVAAFISYVGDPAQGTTLLIKDAWARPAGEGRTGAVYLTIENPTEQDDTLIAVSSTIAEAVEIHQTLVRNDIASMVVVDELLIAAGKRVQIDPLGYHLMLLALQRDLDEGDHFPITLHFASGDEISLEVKVEWEHTGPDEDVEIKTTTLTLAEPLPNEFRIVIPAGTGDLIDAGQDPGIIPEEIRLKLGQKDILTIVNNDLVDHVVGPFFIRAGESLRQTFRTVAVYVGGCSIHQDQQVQIIVEE